MTAPPMASALLTLDANRRDASASKGVRFMMTRRISLRSALAAFGVGAAIALSFMMSKSSTRPLPTTANAPSF
ncbi:hypothetical protein [Streptomyces sp. NPDC021562]|uniref:hypothetical protein n=1 Tax=Streptomyces sp. NPDC021562 TaxID=3155121 RepID=UPI0034032754